MRMQLRPWRRSAPGVLVGLLALALPASAASPPQAAVPATVTAGARVDMYVDPWLSVWSPVADGQVQVGGRLEASARWRVDVLTSATPSLVADAVTSATQFQETRHEASVGLGLLGEDERALRAAWTTSMEPDYATHLLSLQGTTSLAGRSATLGAALSASFETVGRSDRADFVQENRGQTLELSWTQIVGPRTAVTLLGALTRYSCGELIGCQANPYRRIGVFTASISGAYSLSAAERHPARRLRAAVAARVAQAMGLGLALHAGYRYYGDSWQVNGHTAELAVARGWWSDRLVLRLQGRTSSQGPATFYRGRYVVAGEADHVPGWRTADRKLAGVRSAEVGLLTSWRATRSLRLPLRLDLQASRLWFRYPDYASQPERDAWVVGGGLGAEF